MPDSPTALAACDEKLPLLPIMRQFDFGQFVFLHHTPPENERRRTNRKHPRRVVIDPSGGRYEAFRDWLDRQQRLELELPDRTSRPPLIYPTPDPLGGISLTRMLEGARTPASTPTEMRVPAAGFGS